MFPSTWPAMQIYRYALFFCVGVLCWSYQRRKRPGRRTEQLLGVFGLVFIGLCAVGYLFSEVWPVPAAILAQAYRSSSYVTIFLLLYLAGAVWLLWEERGSLPRVAAGILLVAALLPAYRDLLLVAAFLLLWTARRELDSWAALPAAVLLCAFPFVHGFKVSAAGIKPLVEFVGSLFSHRVTAVTWSSLIGWFFLRRHIEPRWRTGAAALAFLLWYPVVLGSGFAQREKAPDLKSDWLATICYQYR